MLTEASNVQFLFSFSHKGVDSTVKFIGAPTLKFYLLDFAILCCVEKVPQRLFKATLYNKTTPDQISLVTAPCMVPETVGVGKKTG